ncbi:MAG: choice-of-anchor D domain-containing protein [Deltaproteobacteria bacterium]|nr:choice-of-anchor D domain-containing protein [Deltaproteobacteria bacterium]
MIESHESIGSSDPTITQRRAFALALIVSSGCDCGGGDALTQVVRELSVAPQVVDFGAVAVGTLSARQVRLTNEGTVALVITSIEGAASGSPFAISGEAPRSIPPKASVDLGLAFLPRTRGLAEDTFRIEVLDEGVHDLTLTGRGIVPGVELEIQGESCQDAPGSLSFGTAAVSVPVEKSLRLRAIGSVPVTILSAEIRGSDAPSFSVVQSPVGERISPPAAASLTLRFDPAREGPVSAEVNIITDAPDGALTVSLCGAGIIPVLCATPVPLDFGSIVLGQTATASLRVSNCGSETLALAGAEISMDGAYTSDPGFAVEGSAPSALDPAESFDLTIRYTAAVEGPSSGYLRIATDSMIQATAYFPLTGRGLAPCELSAVPDRLFFFGIPPSTYSERNVMVLNETMQPCTITRLEIIGSSVFSLQGGARVPEVVDSGDVRQLTVRFAPTGPGPDSAVLELEANGSTGPTGSTERIELSGNGPVGEGCHLQATPDFLSFGVVAPSIRQSRSVELVNVSEFECTVTGVTVDPASDPGFGRTAQPVAPLAPRARAVIEVSYTAVMAGRARGRLTVESNDVTVPILQIPLFAESPRPGICVDPTHLSYGAVQGFRDLSFDIIACGGRDVWVTGLPFSRSDPQFSILAPPTFPFQLAAGSRQTISVRYTPSGSAGASATIEVTSDSEPSDVPVILDGGPEIVPVEAGRFLYSWSATIRSGVSGDINRLPLQGAGARSSYWGSGTNKPCSGCHSVSPDGRYVALVELTFPPTVLELKVIDTLTDSAVTLPFSTRKAFLASWRPDVATNPPYQFAFDDDGVVKIASVTGGVLRELQGANDRQYRNKMPSWGPNGQIAFVRGTSDLEPSLTRPTTAVGFSGISDVMLVDENGGTPVPLNGASGNNLLNYYPTHSPDGGWIALTTSRSGSTYAANDSRVVLVAADNSGAVSDLTSANGSSGASFPTWSADGSLLSFSCPPNRGGQGDWDIWYVPIDGATGRDGPAVNLVEANSSGFDHIARWTR